MAHVSRSVSCVALALCLSSCFTQALWNLDDDDDWEDEEVVPGTVTSQGYAPDNAGYAARTEPESESGMALLLGRVAATPFTLLLDLVTAPIQAFFSDDDDRPRKKKGSIPQAPLRNCPK